MARVASVSIVSVIAVLVFSSMTSAAAVSSAITDPVGDARWVSPSQAGPQSERIPAYQDIAAASVSKEGSTFTFSMEMAGAIPDAPSLSPNGVKLDVWVWPVIPDLSFSACGDPIAPGHCFNGQFDVRVHWDGTSFSAFLLDRRPLATGGEAVYSPVPFSIQGGEIRVFVDAAAIGDPTSFYWLALTADWLSPHFETSASKYLDFAPDGENPIWPS